MNKIKTLWRRIITKEEAKKIKKNYGIEAKVEGNELIIPDNEFIIIPDNNEFIIPVKEIIYRAISVESPVYESDEK